MDRTLRLRNEIACLRLQNVSCRYPRRTKGGRMGDRCGCGTTVRFGFERLGCIECGAACCPGCSYQLESTHYCGGCAGDPVAEEGTRMESRGKASQQLLRDEPYLFTGGIYSPLDAQIAERAGMKSIYLSGYSVAMLNGWPDMGLLTMTEVAKTAS